MIENNLEIELMAGEYKNYRLICSAMKWKIQSGKAKQLQLKELERYCEYHKKGNSFIVDKVFETPIPKVDNRKGNSGKSEGSRGNNTGIYIENVEKILLNHFSYVYSKNYGDPYYSNNNELGKVCGFINSNFKVANVNRGAYTEIAKEKGVVNELACKHILDLTKDSFKGVIERTLSKLQKQGYLSYTIGYTIISSDTNVREYCRMANKKELEIIEETERDILDTLEIKEKKHIFASEKNKKLYYKLFNKLIVERLDDCSKVFKGYEIIVDEKIKSSKKKEIDILKANINELFRNRTMDKIHKTVNSEYIVKIKESLVNWWGELPSDISKDDKARVDENYINDCQINIEILLNLKSQNITDNIIKKNNELGSKSNGISTTLKGNLILDNGNVIKKEELQSLFG